MTLMLLTFGVMCFVAGAVTVAVLVGVANYRSACAEVDARAAVRADFARRDAQAAQWQSMRPEQVDSLFGVRIDTP